MFVRHELQSEWGLGKILAVKKHTLTINFNNGGVMQFDRTITPLRIIRGEAVFPKKNGLRKTVGIVYYFARPHQSYSLKDFKKHPPPHCSGVYGWYFDELPPYVSQEGCSYIRTRWWPFRKKWWLLYNGQAKNLRDRIVNYHIKGRHYAEGTMSSFRMSLGCLLSDKFGLMLSYPPETFGKKEEKLNSWLEDHARVAWVETEYLDKVEQEAIRNFILPLNHGHNQHPLKEPLSDLRTEFREIAKSEKPKKKHFKKAYRTFTKECKELGIKK